MPTPSPSDPLDLLDTDYKLPAQYVLSGRYEIVRELGAGGLGIVYLAYDKLLEMEMAVKVLKPSLARDPEAVRRLIKEARIAMGLTHKNITRVHNFEGHGEMKFLMMEYIDGMTLAQKKIGNAAGKLPLDCVVHYVKQLCEGLEYAHEKKIVHRDIKPANLMVNKEEVVKIADFGIARAVQPSVSKLSKVMTSGTLLYMSPEQVRGEGVDVQSDLYSLGAVVYELLSGHPPFHSGGIEYQILHVLPQPVEGMPERINQVLLKALEKSKEQRWKTARELREALEGKLKVETRKEELKRTPSVAARPADEERRREPTPAPALPPPRSHKLWPWAASGAILALLVGWLVTHNPLLPEGTFEVELKRKEHAALEKVPNQVLGPTDEARRWGQKQWQEAEQRSAEPGRAAGRQTEEKPRVHQAKTYHPLSEKIRKNKNTPPSVLTVSPLGRGSYRTIGEAIRNARPSTRILVRPGFYKEGLVIDKPLEIIGDGRMEDIVIASTDSSCLLMQTDYAVVRGLTLRAQAGTEGDLYFGVDIPKGRLVLEDCDISSEALACVRICGAWSHPIIRRCKIHDGKQSGIYVSKDGQGVVEACDIFANTYSGIAITTGGNPVIRRCQIHDGKQSGIYVYKNGQGVVEECGIFGNGYAGVAIYTGGNPVIRRCKIYNGQYNGIQVFENGQGTVEHCDIFGNATSGVEIRAGGNPVIRWCRINSNKYVAVGAYQRGAGRVENCDLTGNARAAWRLEDGSVLQRSGNKE